MPLRKGTPIPIENPDILRELDVFGDVRVPNMYTLDPKIIPVYTIRPVTEAIPVYGAGADAVAVAANFSYAELVNLPTALDQQGRKVNLRPRFISIQLGVAVAAISIFTAASPFIIGAATQTYNGVGLDGRRGPGGNAPASAGLLRFNSAATYVAPIPKLLFVHPANTTLFLPEAFVQSIVIAPNQTLGFLCLSLNTEFVVDVG